MAGVREAYSLTVDDVRSIKDHTLAARSVAIMRIAGSCWVARSKAAAMPTSCVRGLQNVGLYPDIFPLPAGPHTTSAAEKHDA
jgi:hypothetical protein